MVHTSTTTTTAVLRATVTWAETMALFLAMPTFSTNMRTMNFVLVPGFEFNHLPVWGPAGSLKTFASGFTTGFSFTYSAPFFTGDVYVYSGLNRTGTLLATLVLPGNVKRLRYSGCMGHNYCPTYPEGVTFAGTAKSVNFSGTADCLVYDNITLGSGTPITTTPLPAPPPLRHRPRRNGFVWLAQAESCRFCGGRLIICTQEAAASRCRPSVLPAQRLGRLGEVRASRRASSNTK